jgi:HD superfamily phosphohydrolase
VPKVFHEIRDPIHVFVRVDTDERRVIDSRPVQRLRHIHQLAMSYLVYPGATHRRFEHSLGVMELAGRVFDVVTHPDAIHPTIRELLPEITDQNKLAYWRRVIRMAGLLHDIGHLPFSHAAERELLPEGWDHERLTVEIIRSPEMQDLWASTTPPLRMEDLTKLAVGPKKLKEAKFTDWEAILSDIIVDDEFGVDRMDYLLRDSHHAGVPYGRFDHYRLIDTLRILPRSSADAEGSVEPALGVEEGGLRSAEALLLARYFMYTQMYFHPVRRAYDIHLKDFLTQWLPGGTFPTAVDEHLKLTDNEVTAAILEAAYDDTKPGHHHARRTVQRDHFRLLYQQNPEDLKLNPEAGRVVFEKVRERYGEEKVRRDAYAETPGVYDFPVLMKDGRVMSGYNLSTVLQNLPVAAFDYTFVSPDVIEEARPWLEKDLQSM